MTIRDLIGKINFISGQQETGRTLRRIPEPPDQVGGRRSVGEVGTTEQGRHHLLAV